MSAVSYYEVLGVPEDASRAEIKKSWMKLTRLTHPDSGGEGANEDKYQLIQEAWGVLGSEKSRAEYDSTLGGGASAPPPETDGDTGPDLRDDDYYFPKETQPSPETIFTDFPSETEPEAPARKPRTRTEYVPKSPGQRKEGFNLNQSTFHRVEEDYTTPSVVMSAQPKEDDGDSDVSQWRQRIPRVTKVHYTPGYGVNAVAASLSMLGAVTCAWLAHESPFRLFGAFPLSNVILAFLLAAIAAGGITLVSARSDSARSASIIPPSTVIPPKQFSPASLIAGLAGAAMLALITFVVDAPSRPILLAAAACIAAFGTAVHLGRSKEARWGRSLRLSQLGKASIWGEVKPRGSVSVTLFPTLKNVSLSIDRVTSHLPWTKSFYHVAGPADEKNKAGLVINPGNNSLVTPVAVVNGRSVVLVYLANYFNNYGQKTFSVDELGNCQVSDPTGNVIGYFSLTEINNRVHAWERTLGRGVDVSAVFVADPGGGSIHIPDTMSTYGGVKILSTDQVEDYLGDMFADAPAIIDRHVCGEIAARIYMPVADLG